jgi:hypothetical protein
MVGNKVALYMGLKRADGLPAVMGVDMKAGPDYAFLEVPAPLPKKKSDRILKAGEPAVLSSGLVSTPHRARTYVYVNPALDTLGTVTRQFKIIEEGDSSEIEVVFTPKENFDLTNLSWLVRLYCVE